jgi:hypothetical protein
VEFRRLEGGERLFDLRLGLFALELGKPLDQQREDAQLDVDLDTMGNPRRLQENHLICLIRSQPDPSLVVSIMEEPSGNAEIQHNSPRC